MTIDDDLAAWARKWRITPTQMRDVAKQLDEAADFADVVAPDFGELSIRLGGPAVDDLRRILRET